MTLSPVLVLTSEPATFADVAQSLKLLGREAVQAKSVREAKALILEKAPCLVIARPSVADDQEAALKLARDLEAAPLLKSLPVVLLHGETELFAVDPIFSDTLPFPVQFPAFSHRAQALINGVAIAGQRQDAPPPLTLADRLSLVDAFHQEVRKALEADEEFRSATESTLLERHRIVSDKVAATVTIKGLRTKS